MAGEARDVSDRAGANRQVRLALSAGADKHLDNAALVGDDLFTRQDDGLDLEAVAFQRPLDRLAQHGVRVVVGHEAKRSSRRALQ